jgi:hypothetical protein
VNLTVKQGLTSRRLPVISSLVITGAAVGS